jgi:phosphonate transport system permease protein
MNTAKDINSSPWPENAPIPSKKYKRKLGIFLIILMVVSVFSVYLDFNFLLLFTDFHYVVDLGKEMYPPNLSVLTSKPEILRSIFQTISMAFLGTILGGFFAILLAFLGADNTTPNRMFGQCIKFILAVERVIPGLVVILFFLIIVGLGPFAGMLSIAIGSIGMFGKLFADAIEHCDYMPVESLYSSGANKLQAIKYAIMPQVLPSFIGNLFYAFDINLRAAIGLGVFGGGGIGYEIHMAMQMLRYKDALALILFTIVMISLLEKMSDAIRKKVIGKEVLH